VHIAFYDGEFDSLVKHMIDYIFGISLE